MKKAIIIFVCVIGALIVGIGSMFIFQLCPPQGPWPMPPWCMGKEGTPQLPPKIASSEGETIEEESVTKSELITLNLTVTVPYWTKGDVYLGVDDNLTYYKLEKVNSVTYKGEVPIKKGSIYYYSLGKEGTRSVNNFTAIPLFRTLDAVVDWENSNKRIIKKGFQKGVTFGAMKWDEWEKRFIDQSMNALEEFNVEWIIIIPDWFVFPNVTGTEIKPFYPEDGEFPNPTGWITPTLTDDELRDIIRKAKSKGLKVVLKPHVDPIDFGMVEGSNRGSLRPTDWDEWFKNYEKFILHYAKLAQEENVDMFVVGTELDTATIEAPNAEERWREIIRKVREKYEGPLTYSVSCHEKTCWAANQIKFWDALDYIGFEPYFGLTDKNDPTIEEMKRAFDRMLDKHAKALSEKYQKPVIFTEANVYSYDGANKDPINPAKAIVPDLQEQADYYEALFQSIENKDYIKGVYWWAWHMSNINEDPREYINTWDSFIKKPAGQVMKKWYGKIES